MISSTQKHLKFVVEVVECWDIGLETLADTDTPDEVLEFRTLLEGG